MSDHYLVNEIFYSLQGEGVRAGTANVFVRLAHCNLRCQMAPGLLSPGGWDCDTEFEAQKKMTGKEILAEASERGNACLSVIFTGGEPLLQLDEYLIDLFRDAGWYVCIETNGSKALPSNKIDWVTVSPKVAEHAVQISIANEVKYVRAEGQPLPDPFCEAQYFLLSPAFAAEGLYRKNLEWCINLVKENPKWRLSVQQHKAWSVR